jgi:hypothetical protein
MWAQAVPTPTPVITSSQVPPDVDIPSGFSKLPIAFFDDYSWRAFIALVWPARQGQRGVPDPNQSVGGGGPRVFETYKTLNEVFHDDGEPPSEWNEFDLPKYNPCGRAGAWDELTLGSFSKFSDLGQAGFGSLTGPLIAQNTTYVRFLTAYNQTEFEQILGNKWYLRCNLPQQPASTCPSPTPAPGTSPMPAPTTITFNLGSIDVKSAWMEMTGVQHPERYHTRTAWVLDPTSTPAQCVEKKMGLVGLHIVQKTLTRPQWIWSTFEQVDNVPSPQGGTPFGPGTGNFNSGKPPAMPSKNPYTMDQVLTPPTLAPFNVSRVKDKDIAKETNNTNMLYRKALAGTVWENYQLVMTQWPVPGDAPANQGDPAHSFPGMGATTAFANVTMETFEQNTVFKSCMACHNATMGPTDFVWSLNDHAFPANKNTPNFAQNPAFQKLRSIMEIKAVPEKKVPEKKPPGKN